jgi:hypothetical protein
MIRGSKPRELSGGYNFIIFAALGDWEKRMTSALYFVHTLLFL